MHRRIAAVLSSILVLGAARAAEDAPSLVPRAEDEVTITAWDGTPEDGLGWQSTVMVGEYVQRFDYYAGQTTRVTVCPLTNAGTDTTAMGSVVIYDVGPDGNPGDLLFESPETTFTLRGLSNYICVPVATGGIQVNEPIYAGFRWRASQFTNMFLAADFSPTTPQQQLRGRSRIGGTLGAWGNVTNFAPQIRAFGISLVAVPEGSVSPVCTPGPTVMCLNNNRYKVEGDWRRPNGQTGPAQVVGFGSDDSGLFYFFDPDNWEMLIKVLNACGPPFDRYWVFYAATTNVEFTVTVTDTQSGMINNYFNPLGMAAAPIQDTSAFATCP